MTVAGRSCGLPPHRTSSESNRASDSLPEDMPVNFRQRLQRLLLAVSVASGLSLGPVEAASTVYAPLRSRSVVNSSANH